MCGIAGELRFEKGPSEADWRLLDRLMRRRGPDDSGLWSDEEYCTLAFRRLAILDLSPLGNQPMMDKSERYALVFNGEIYNFRDIRRELEGKGFVFASSGDGEVVLKALIAWNTDALDRFNGIFAIAFYDRQTKELLLARDHAGIKPLYFLTGKNGVTFASQLDQILAHPWSKGHEVDQQALGLYLRIGYIPAPYSILQDSSMLEPGAWVRFDTEGKRCGGNYWQPLTNVGDKIGGDDAVDAVDQTIAAAVKRQLVSDVPVGAFLSGGIDSPLVVAKMVEAGHPEVRTFTIGTKEHESDESIDARLYATELGVDQVIENITPDRVLELLPEVIEASTEPFGDYSIFPTMLVSKLASREFKVMLSGDGGDELFWGYPERTAQLIISAPDLRTPHLLRRMRSAFRMIAGRGKSVDLKYRTIGDWYLERHTRMRDSRLKSIFPQLRTLPDDFNGFDFASHDRSDTAEWLRWNEFMYHLTMVLLKVDRASMHFSQEVRVPLLDKEVINVAARVDWRSCIDLRRKQGKLPLRKSLAKHVRHQTQVKKGFEAPMAEWLRGPLRQQFEELVLGQPELLGQAIDRRYLQTVYDEHLSGHQNHARGLWPLLSLALWKDAHFSARYH